MKRVYFVRHGESEANVSPVDIGHDTPLTIEGERQALEIAKRFAKIDVDVLIVSPLLRTRETARMINEVLKKPLEYHEYFVEKRQPSGGLGSLQKRHHDLMALKHFFDPTWKESDEDSFEEIKNRALAALDYLIKRPEESILVVTHGWFLKLLIAVQLFGNSLTVDEYRRMWAYLGTKNTGLTLTEYDPDNINRGWRLITWNDHAHLG